MQFKVNKKMILEDGPWDKNLRATIQHNVNLNNVLSQNYDNNKGNYLLNPFVSGPLTHGSIKISNAINGGIYDIFKSADSPAAPTTPTVVADVNKGPWNAEKDVLTGSLGNTVQALNKSKTEHPFQYYLNPYVPGPVKSAFINVTKTANENIRNTLSPTTTSGDTLIKK